MTPIVLLVSLTVAFLVLAFFRERWDRQPQRVESYVISLDKLDGSPRIQLKFMTGHGRDRSYEFPPGYAHRLSDELCQAAALAVRGA